MAALDRIKYRKDYHFSKYIHNPIIILTNISSCANLLAVSVIGEVMVVVVIDGIVVVRGAVVEVVTLVVVVEIFVVFIFNGYLYWDVVAVLVVVLVVSGSGVIKVVFVVDSKAK